MGTKTGLWIDRTRAVIVDVNAKGGNIRVIESGVDRQPRRSNGLIGTTSQPIPADDKAARAYAGHLNAYYDNVISSLRGTESILIFGPGLAKQELKKRIEKKGLAKRIVGIETVPKMTERQVAAKVRRYFPNLT